MSDQPSRRSLILTIDDDAMIRLILHDVLEREGFEVVSVPSAYEGIESVKSRLPDLLLLDVMMPEISGFDCLLALRAMPGVELLPIVMMTGSEDIDSINHAFQLGATDFISKPISWPTLPHRLRYLIRASSALSQLAKRETELRTAQKIARLGSWDLTVASDKLQWSEEVFNVLSVQPDTFQGRRQDLYQPFASADAEKLHRTIENCIKHKKSFHLQCQLHRDCCSDLASSHVCVVLIRGEPVMDGHHVVRIQGTIQDITEQKKTEEQIRFLSFYDPLTGLPNRNRFKEILAPAMAQSNAQSVKLSALFISIDRFKRINETLGPDVGDQVLKMFADRLLSEIRDHDNDGDPDHAMCEITLFRLGGNEFTLLLNYIRDSSYSVKIAERICQIMAKSFNVEKHEIFLSINIGIALYPGDGIDEDSFMKNGKFAMSHAKDQGQNTYQFFSKSLNVAAYHKLSMENSLRRAIERNELLLYYQPKVNMRQKCVIGCEALIRWQHPELGLVSPLQFIPIAEDSGLIIDISNWVLETACTQMCDWQLQELPPLVMAINVSAKQFRQADFVGQVQQLLTRLGLSPQHLTLELTESILLEDIEDAMVTLRELRTLGVEISIDDFGTGYSSLAYLKKLPISELKIDRSFIRDIPNNEEDMAITTAILALAKSLSLDVVAEGVEREAQVDFLLHEGCEIAQGFLYSKPLAAADFAAFILQFVENSLVIPNR